MIVVVGVTVGLWIGAWGDDRSMRSPAGNPRPAPGSRTARIARTKRQINGAKSFVG